MLKIKPEDHKLAAKILDIVRGERGSGLTKADSIKRLSEAIHEIWELRGADNPQGFGQRSASLRKVNSIDEVIDHPVPSEHLAKMLLSMPNEDYRAPYIAHLLHKFAFFCFISPEEKKLLGQAGIADKMPADWNGIDRYARYTEVGISMGEVRIFGKEELRELLSNPLAPFYVYRLLTPTGKVFYIGKGENYRALTHEKELFKNCYRTHTNWKKLNKIGKIIHSGKAVAYEIESWHVDETQAYLREDELILIAERENPYVLTNSNGSRWAGKASRQLCELRKARGLDTGS